MANLNQAITKSVFRLDLQDTEEDLVNKTNVCRDCSKVSYILFARYLNVQPSDSNLYQLFKIYDKVLTIRFKLMVKSKTFICFQDSTGVIDFRDYLLSVLGCSKNRATLEAIYLAFKVHTLN